MTLKFDGKVDQDGFYAWLNPDLPHDQTYNRDRLLSAYVEVDEGTYDHFLGMLPPLHYTSRGFAICEATTADIRLGFFRVDGRYFAAHVSDYDTAHTFGRVRGDIITSAEREG